MAVSPRQSREIVILQFDEVKRLLKAAMVYRDGLMASSVAIMLFAGLRPSELEALQKSDVKSAYLSVYKGKMEGIIKRRVEISPVLKVWQKQYPFNGRPKGWGLAIRVLKQAVMPQKWGSDVLRHTSISYQVERDEDTGKVATRNGTGVDTIKLHYWDVIDDPNHVKAFWKLTPDAVKSAKLPGSLPKSSSHTWPSDSGLKKLVWQKPLSHLAKDLGISDNAIRKRCLGRGINLPGKGHWQRVRGRRRKV